MEKVFKSMTVVGITNIVVGSVIGVTGLIAGVLTIINGVQLLKNRNDITF